MRRNSRRSERTEYQGEIIVQWDDPRGGARYATAKCVNIGESGVSLHMHQSIPTGIFVTFRIDRLKLAGRASIRHCAKRGAYFLIGLEFAGGLKYTETAPLSLA